LGSTDLQALGIVFIPAFCIFSIFWVGTGHCARPPEVGLRAHLYQWKRYCLFFKNTLLFCGYAHFYQQTV